MDPVSNYYDWDKILQSIWWLLHSTVPHKTMIDKRKIESKNFMIDLFFSLFDIKHIFRVLSIPSDPFQELNLKTFVNKCFLRMLTRMDLAPLISENSSRWWSRFDRVLSCKIAKNYGCNQHEQLKSANILFQREAEKETPEDLKQAFRVFDKVSLTLKSFYFHCEML